MTVASLWKALDRAGCGKPVGIQEIKDHHGLADRKMTNPWNCNQMALRLPPTLAIDLSIWICESLNSSAMAENHADPTMHLVFSRTIKLLHLGIKLVGVLEGKKRRIANSEGERTDQFQKRRGGTRFWRACEKCEIMLEILGVPVVRAKAEGEALCSLLNEKGIVDGVISNDGDCFLFGAKVLYTKFSIENLNQGKVMRYDANSLVACLDDDDHDEYDWKVQMDSRSPPDIVTLSRSDLVVFAIITGSDMAGSGISKVGCRKALRFIRKCQIDNPLRSNTAAYDEIVSWSKVAKGHCGTLEPHDDEPKCSSCHHRGTKARHFKHGCERCGTSPGECCFLVSPGGKFRQALRNKALAMNPRFDPETVSNAYHNPNDNQIPVQFVGLRSQDVLMETPDLHRFLEAPLIVRGRSSSESRAYVLQSLSQLMARTELSHLYESSRARENRSRNNIPRSNKNKPLPLKIVKEVTRSSLPCFQVLWKVNATSTDSNGNPIDEYEFSTIEDRIMVKKCFPDIFEKFLLEEKERVKQGNAEQERRKAFLDFFIKSNLHPKESNEQVLGETMKLGRGKRDFFQKRDHDVCTREDRGTGNEKGVHISGKMGDDAAMLLYASAPHPCKRQVYIENESIETVSTLSCATYHMHQPGESDREFSIHHHNSDLYVIESPYKFKLIPSHLYFLASTTPLEPYDDTLENRKSRSADFHLGERIKSRIPTSIDRHDDVGPYQPQFKSRPLKFNFTDSPSVQFDLSPTAIDRQDNVAPYQPRFSRPWMFEFSDLPPVQFDLSPRAIGQQGDVAPYQPRFSRPSMLEFPDSPIVQFDLSPRAIDRQSDMALYQPRFSSSWMMEFPDSPPVQFDLSPRAIDRQSDVAPYQPRLSRPWMLEFPDSPPVQFDLSPRAINRQSDVAPYQPRFSCPWMMEFPDSPPAQFDLSPCIKRSRFSNRPRSTQ